MSNFSISPVWKVEDISVNAAASPAGTPLSAPGSAQAPKQPSIYGEVPKVPVLEAVEGIKFDFNDGIRILMSRSRTSTRGSSSTATTRFPGRM